MAREQTQRRLSHCPKKNCDMRHRERVWMTFQVLIPIYSCCPADLLPLSSGKYQLSTLQTGASQWCNGKENAYQSKRRGFDPWVGKIPWRRKWQPTPALLALKIPWTEELGAGYYLWDRKGSGTTNDFTFFHFLLPSRVTWHLFATLNLGLFIRKWYPHQRIAVRSK